MGDVLLPAASRASVRADDRAALAASAAPGVADPVQPIAAQLGRGLAEPYRADGHVMRYARIMEGRTAVRQCISCGVVATVDPVAPCPDCGASSFHLIPLRTQSS